MLASLQSASKCFRKNIIYPNSTNCSFLGCLQPHQVRPQCQEVHRALLQPQRRRTSWSRFRIRRHRKYPVDCIILLACFSSRSATGLNLFFVQREWCSFCLWPSAKDQGITCVVVLVVLVVAVLHHLVHNLFKRNLSE